MPIRLRAASRGTLKELLLTKKHILPVGVRRRGDRSACVTYALALATPRARPGAAAPETGTLYGGILDIYQGSEGGLLRGRQPYIGRYIDDLVMFLSIYYYTSLLVTPPQAHDPGCVPGGLLVVSLLQAERTGSWEAPCGREALGARRAELNRSRM
jgi:hypothetical protein